jgi:hypothetical protein
MAAGSQGHDPVAVHNGERVIEDEESLSVALRGSSEHRREVLGSAHLKRLERDPQLPDCQLSLLPEDCTDGVCRIPERRPE